MSADAAAATAAAAAASSSSSSSPAAAAAASAGAGAAPPSSSSPTGDYYFDSYSHYGIHMEMLKDSHRTGSYRDAILMNPHVFKGKTVLDVGCGTGILSMFAAKAGAAKVVAIDCSSIAKQAKEIVALNGYADVITVIKGRLEELDLPDLVGKVGAPGVKLFPSHANMFVSGIHDPQYIQDRFDAWNSVEGFDFSFCRRQCFIEPLVDTVASNQIATTCEKLVGFDLAKVTEPELTFEEKVTLTATRDDTIHALEVHFNTPFDAAHERVVLETAPWSQTTHWRQSVLYLINFLKVAKGDQIHVQLRCAPNKHNPRDLDICVKIDLEGTFQSSHFTQDFRMR